MSLLSGKKVDRLIFIYYLSGHKARQTPPKWTLKNSFMFGAIQRRRLAKGKKCVDSFNTFFGWNSIKVQSAKFSSFFKTQF